MDHPPKFHKHRFSLAIRNFGNLLNISFPRCWGLVFRARSDEATELSCKVFLIIAQRDIMRPFLLNFPIKLLLIQYSRRAFISNLTSDKPCARLRFLVQQKNRSCLAISQGHIHERIMSIAATVTTGVRAAKRVSGNRQDVW